MEHKVCLSCGISVPQKTGKKPRLYCGSICRQRDWYKKRKEALDRLTGKGGIPLPADFMNIKAIGILKGDGTVEPLKFPQATGLKLAVQAFEELKSDIKYVTPTPEFYDGEKLGKFTADEPALFPVLSSAKPLKPKKQPDVPKIEEKAALPPKIEPERHPLWKQGDPKENSGAFFLKYDCNNYSELEKLKK
jgi:hypothetical protein